MKPRRVFIWAIAAILIFPTPMVFAYGGNGGSGGDGGGGDGGDGLTGEIRGDSLQPPEDFVPMEPVFVFDDPQKNSTSVDPMPVVEYIPLPQEVEDGMIAIMVVGGSIFIGYATAGQVWWVQAGSAAAYSGATTILTNPSDPEKQSSPTRAAVTAAGVSFIPVPPPAQEAISQAIGLIPAPSPPDFSKLRGRTRFGGYGSGYGRTLSH